jgi:hypothetical protein
VAKLTAAERFGMNLHPRIAHRVEQQFLLKEFELAVLAAMKEVEVRDPGSDRHTRTGWSV